MIESSRRRLKKIRAILAGAALGFIFYINPEYSLAQEVRIIEARRNIPLSDSEPRYMDLYLSGGSANGIKVDSIYKVVRTLPIRGALGTQDFGSIKILVGEVKIIFSDSRTSIGRIYKIYSREKLPILETESVMIGDEVDLSKSIN